MVVWTRLVAVEMVRIAGILNILGVRANMSSDGLDVGIYMKEKSQKRLQVFWLKQSEEWIRLQL